MRIKLVKINKDDHGNWKGTWYKAGDFHFVTETIAPHIGCRYRAVDVAGGIMESDCELQKGVAVWWKCFKKASFKDKLGLVT